MSHQRPNRRDVLLTGLAAAILPRAAAAQPATAPDYSFLTLGDWGRGNAIQGQVARSMNLVARQIGSRFVVTVGDNFYGSGVASVTDPQWVSKFENMYDPQSMGLWYPGLGNHDYLGNEDAQIAYTKPGGRWQMPARYYRQSIPAAGVRSLDLFIIDTNPIVEGRASAAAQKTWLDAQLAAAPAGGWKLVFGHHGVTTSGSAHGGYPKLEAWFGDSLKRYGVQAYICGHDHHLEHITRPDLDYIVSGGGGDADNLAGKLVAGSSWAQKLAGFTAYRISKDSLTVDFFPGVAPGAAAAPVPAYSATIPFSRPSIALAA